MKPEKGKDKGTKKGDGSLFDLSILDKLGIDIDVNKAIKQILAVADSLNEDTNAIIFNATETDVAFRCYQASDVLRWIPAREAFCPPEGTALLNKADFAPGPTIQVIAIVKDADGKGHKMGPFQVLRHHAYLWTGGMFVEAVRLDDAGEAKAA